MKIGYDTANGHRLELIAIRHDGRGLFNDLDDGSRIVCDIMEPDSYPRPVVEFKPIR